jgi:four helix bundle protein
VDTQYNTRFGLDTFELYNYARQFRIKVYRVLKSLPSVEKFCLGTQMRRAAISITNNLAEGHGRWHYQENIHFCRIARGSLEETIDDLNICQDEGYADFQTIEEMKNDAQVLRARINSYIAYLRRSKQSEE